MHAFEKILNKYILYLRVVDIQVDMTTIRPSQNIRIFWKEMYVFNLEYYYHMLTDKQRLVSGIHNIFKTFTRYQKKMLTVDLESTKLQFQPILSSALALHFDTDVSSVIYAYV
jgi:hypothetical protein